MRDFSTRIADLPLARRLLFERLLEAKTAVTVGGNAVRSRRNNESTASGELVFDPGASATETKGGYRYFYNGVSEQLNATEFGDFSFFLNYGYAPDHNPQYARVQLPEWYLNKNSVRLVLELVGELEIAGRKVLDVGCGRGGTVSVIHKFFAPLTAIGVDLSSAAISFCGKAHRGAGVAFLEGDAEDLPFRNESFDVVTNVESSHSYPEIGKFYSEVCRVLNRGGYFLYTDVLPVDRMEECTNMLGNLGFSVERAQDITTNVLLSCDQIARARAGAFENDGGSPLLREFLALPDSDVYKEMALGQCSYMMFRLKKAEGVQGGN